MTKPASSTLAVIDKNNSNRSSVLEQQGKVSMIIHFSFLFCFITLLLLSTSNGNCEAVPRTAERFGVQTHYYRLPMWPVICVTKNVMVQQTLGWFGAYPEKQ